MKKTFILFLIFIGLFIFTSRGEVKAQDAKLIIEDAWNYWRGKSSQAVVDMTVHRPEWERTVTIKAWTKGMKDSLFMIAEPPKDKGNGTLKKGREMWMYNPKVKRVIKIPPSMMAQSWMGSDFSNNDLSKTDSILEDYTHEIIRTETEDDHKVFVIKAIPKPNAPVVWGMEILKIRDDNILIQESFYDEDKKLVKELTASQIEMLGGRLYPRVWYMRKIEKKDEYTKIFYKDAKFDLNMPDRHFSLSNLKNPRGF